MTNPPANALQRLIRTRMRELNRSYADVSRIGGIPRSTVHHLATHDRPVRLPNPATVKGLATGLDLPPETVRNAAASAAGFSVDTQHVGDPETEVLIASLARLSPEDRRHVAALVQSLLGNGQSRPQP
jgi:hypothetical protein